MLDFMVNIVYIQGCQVKALHARSWIGYANYFKKSENNA